MGRISSLYITFFVIIVLLLLVACAGQANDAGSAETADREKLSVVATTTIVGDVVANIGGDRIDLQVLMTPDSDPHSFEPSPQDLTELEKADVIFISGLGLEEFLGQMVEGIAGSDKIVSLSQDVETIEFAGGHDHGAEEQEHGNIDPHVWMDPKNVMVWADTVSESLSLLDPENADTYQANAEAYKAKLAELDAWIIEQMDTIPQGNRQLVTDHQAFGYFVHRYGLELVGTVVPGTSTLAEPSAQELADLEDGIRAAGTPAIFVGFSVNPALAERVAGDTGVRLVPLYTGALSAADGPASTYIDLMRYNVEAITEALQ